MNRRNKFNYNAFSRSKIGTVSGLFHCLCVRKCQLQCCQHGTSFPLNLNYSFWLNCLKQSYTFTSLLIAVVFRYVLFFVTFLSLSFYRNLLVSFVCLLTHVRFVAGRQHCMLPFSFPISGKRTGAPLGCQTASAKLNCQFDRCRCLPRGITVLFFAATKFCPRKD